MYATCGNIIVSSKCTSKLIHACTYRVFVLLSSTGSRVPEPRYTICIITHYYYCSMYYGPIDILYHRPRLGTVLSKTYQSCIYSFKVEYVLIEHWSLLLYLSFFFLQLLHQRKFSFYLCLTDLLQLYGWIKIMQLLY